MQKLSTYLLKLVLILIGALALFLAFFLPPREGRAQDLNLFEIYFDPLIITGFVLVGILIFGLLKAFTLLTLISKKKVFTPSAVKQLKNIKLASIFSVAIIFLGVVYIGISHDPSDDPAGFIALSLGISFCGIIIAAAASLFEELLKGAIDIKYENDLTI